MRNISPVGRRPVIAVPSRGPVDEAGHRRMGGRDRSGRDREIERASRHASNRAHRQSHRGGEIDVIGTWIDRDPAERLGGSARDFQRATITKSSVCRTNGENKITGPDRAAEGGGVKTQGACPKLHTTAGDGGGGVPGEHQGAQPLLDQYARGRSAESPGNGQGCADGRVEARILGRRIDELTGGERHRGSPRLHLNDRAAQGDLAEGRPQRAVGIDHQSGIIPESSPANIRLGYTPVRTGQPTKAAIASIDALRVVDTAWPIGDVAQEKGGARPTGDGRIRASTQV